MNRFLLIGLCSLACTGCMKVGPDFTPPEPPIQEGWMECSDEHVSCDKDPIENWWNVFNDPKLNELIVLSRIQNLDLRVACYRIMEARAVLGIAIGEWFPQQQEWVGSITRFEISRNAPNSSFGDLHFWDYQLGFQIAWELDFWGRFRRGIEAASDELYASFANFDDVMVLLFGDVASTYTMIRTIEERIEIVKNNIEVQRRSLEIAEARWQAGMVTELDVQQARALLKGTEARLPVLEADLRGAKNAMAVLLGMTTNEVNDVLDEPGRIPDAPLDVAVGIPAELLCRRPDIRRALYQTAAQSALIGVAMSDFYPSISIGGFVGLESSGDTTMTRTGSGGQLFSPASTTFTLGPSFAWKIFNYGRIKNRVYVEYSRFLQFLTTYQNTVLLAYQEVEDGIISFVKSHEQVNFLDEGVQSAVRAAELSRTQYVEGLADYTRVLNTEQARLELEEQLAIARGDIALSLIATYRALGGGWQFFVFPDCEECE